MSCKARLLLNTVLILIKYLQIGLQNSISYGILSLDIPEIPGKLSKSDHTRNNKIYKKWVEFNRQMNQVGNQMSFLIM